MEQKMHRVEKTWSVYDRLPDSGRAFLRNFWSKIGFSREFGTMFRYEFDMFLLRLWCAISPGYHRHVLRLRRINGLKIHLGCGNTTIPDWINVDCYPPPSRPNCEILTLDMRKGLPFASHSAVAIYTEHFIEHIPFETVRNTLLPEFLRILAPGGHIRVGVPDGEWWINEYRFRKNVQEPSSVANPSDKQTWMMGINSVARDSSHYYLYDYETLEAIFSDAGFVGLRKSRANDSEVPYFRQIDQTDEWRTATTVYIEGIAPKT